MLEKIIENSFDFKEPSYKILNNKCLIKSASEETMTYIKNVKSEPGRTKLLVLFMGAGEYYGSNRNGDYFTEKDLINNYKTFKEHGFVYKNHVNKDPNKKFGYIEFVTYNKKMHRVEGVVSLINDLCTEEIEKINNGEDLAFSMAARLKFDVCSICDHESKTFDEYCEHLKNEMGKIYSDGRKVYARNPNPIFFDISIVWKPADPTAYALKKVASLKNSSKKDLKINLEKNSNLDKLSVLKKLSELEKHIEGYLAGKIEDGNFINILKNVKPEKLPNEVVIRLKNFPLKNVLQSLTKKNVLLSLLDFLKLLKQESEYEDTKCFLPGSFSKMLQEDNLMDFGLDDLKENSFIPGMDRISKILNNFLDNKNLYLDNISNILNNNNNDTKIIKFEDKPKEFELDNGLGKGKSYSRGMIIIKKSNNKVAENLAKIYNNYKLDFYNNNQNKLNSIKVISSNYF